MMITDNVVKHNQRFSLIYFILKRLLFSKVLFLNRKLFLSIYFIYLNNSSFSGVNKNKCFICINSDCDFYRPDPLNMKGNVCHINN